jgi:hypothetical protein
MKERMRITTLLKIYIFSGSMIIGRFRLQKETQKKEDKVPKKRSRSKTTARRQSPGKTTITTEITPSPLITSPSPTLINNKKGEAKRSQNIHWDPDFSVNKTFQPDKENLEMVAEPTKDETPIQYYQEQYIQSVQKITDSLLKTNEAIINLMMSSCNPYWENPYQQKPNQLIPPHELTNDYTNIVSTFVNNLLKISCLVNECILINIEYFKSAIQQTKERSDDLVNACMNMTKILESKSDV